MRSSLAFDEQRCIPYRIINKKASIDVQHMIGQLYTAAIMWKSIQWLLLTTKRMVFRHRMRPGDIDND